MWLYRAPCRAPALCVDQAREQKRVQELLRFFQPVAINAKDTKARVAKDTSLTAFAQLGALKLDCQRSFISLMDNENQYILAEATRTVSLTSEDVHDGGDDDAVYLGATTLDLLWGVCPSTIRLFTSTDGSLNVDSELVKANESYYIMNDLSMVPGFEDRPYVAGWPHMRYYAEVPIHSPSGLTIGSYCVVDNKPRAGLDEKGLKVLKEIADSIMDHLELVMCKQQRERAERMIQGLGLFVEGRASLREWWIKSSRASRSIHSSQRSMTLEERADIEFGHNTRSITEMPRLESISTTGSSSDELINSTVTNSSQRMQIETSRTTSESVTSSSQQKNLKVGTQRVLIETASIDISNDQNHSSTNTLSPLIMTAADKDEETISTDGRSSQIEAPNLEGAATGSSKISTDLEEMLSRATNLIREAIDLEGAIYYDLNLSSHVMPDESDLLAHSKTIDTNERGRPVEISLSNDDTMPSYNKFASRLSPRRRISRPASKMCKVLAYSTRSKSTVKGDAPLLNQMTLPETSLRRICQNHPHGRILNFDANGRPSYSEVRIDKSFDKMCPDEDLTLVQKRPEDTSEEVNSDWLKDSEAEDLLRVMPGARSVVLFPLWDSNRDRWFAYSVAYTTSPTRILQLEELVYLASFGNSVLAELSRLDTLAADRAKADFISSISHELRSPLHGILASAELLRELSIDASQNHLVHTIEDTMDNLLTFAKINSFSVVKRRETRTGVSKLNQTPSDGYRSLTTDLDIRLLVEEVVEASLAGHNFRRVTASPFSSDTASNSNDSMVQEPTKQVMVICDVEWQSNWIFSTQAGAWKRILMNLLGNALKYTESGFIHVSLQFDKDSTVTDKESFPVSVTLSVKDSGTGISEEYLKHHLYKPFAQENALSVGTGLGLSIVRQLVNSLNGSIEITSNTASGTYVKVSAPLNVSNTENTPIDENRLFLTGLRTRLEHLRLGFLGFEDIPSTTGVSGKNFGKLAKSFEVLKSSLKKIAIEWFNMEANTVSAFRPACADIFICPDSQTELVDLRETSKLNDLGVRGNPPTIILCENITPAHREVLKNKEGVIYVTQPFGPQKLAKALALCLEYISHSQKDACTPKDPEATFKFMNTPLDTSNPCEIDGDTNKKDGVNLHDRKFSTSPQGEVIDLELSSQVKSSHQPKLRSRASSPSNNKKRPRVLLVEDNAINLKLLVTYMRKIHCDCVTALDGLQALEAYKQNTGHFDLVFMDISMPVMDGMTSAREIREFERKQSVEPTTIIALTGLASLKAQEEAFSSGIDEFWTKPVPMKKLKAIVEDRFPTFGVSA
ncbi:hypothetical protein MMC17_006452 [Xylographa soralifera]|nr:hypothetical protein [Xylographa soralifera]